MSRFLSTLSLRRATEARSLLLRARHFYPRSPCGERRKELILVAFEGFISIHALLAESDTGTLDPKKYDRTFLSTLSLRRATSTTLTFPGFGVISIHALLAESDIILTALLIQPIRFLSTLSLRRATINTYHRIFGEGISIHALLAESDYDTSSLMQCQAKFLSTLSLRRATGIIDIVNNVIDHFYPRSPCGERPLR